MHLRVVEYLIYMAGSVCNFILVQGSICVALLMWLLPVESQQAVGHPLPNSLDLMAESSSELVDVDVMLNEAVTGWNQLRDVFQHCRGTGELIEEKYEGSNAKQVRHLKTAFWVNEKWKRVDVTNMNTAKLTGYALNSEYAIRADAFSGDNHFVVGRIEPFEEAFWNGIPDGLPGPIETAFHEFFREFVHAGWQLYGLPLQDLVRAEGFVPLNCRFFQTATGKPRIELRFSWTPQNDELSACENISITLIPDRQYALESFVCDYTSHSVSLTVDYDSAGNASAGNASAGNASAGNASAGNDNAGNDNALVLNGNVGDVPVPRTVTRTISSIKRPDAPMVTRYVLHEFERDVIEEAIFRSGVYGLPEPASASGSRRSLLFLVNWGIFVCLLLWLVWRFRRHGATAADQKMV